METKGGKVAVRGISLCEWEPKLIPHNRLIISVGGYSRLWLGLVDVCLDKKCFSERGGVKVVVAVCIPPIV